MQQTLDDVVTEVASIPEGWTATDVSRRAGINRSTLHRISNGAVEPTLTTLRELAIVHGMDMTVQLRPLSDPDAATAATLLLSATAESTDDLPTGVLSWMDRLERIAAGVKSDSDQQVTVATLQVLSAAGRASDLRHRAGAAYLRGRSDALRLASAGDAADGQWALSGGAAPAFSDTTGLPGILWVSDVAATVAALSDTHRSTRDPARAEVIVAPGDECLFRDLSEHDGVCVVAPVRQVVDVCGLGAAAERTALDVARSWWE
ncbi:helix-turn-helix domain-containing protein [Corynebacterium variabile]|uniref:helix-turn-helix domain-containing protein n=1 Tax=Corynebacterium variabile TaxID=1727 RepID=UPI003FCFFC33